MKVPKFLAKGNRRKRLINSDDIYVKEWFVSLFSDMISIDETLKLWDDILKNGDYYLMRITLAVFSGIHIKSEDVYS